MTAFCLSAASCLAAPYDEAEMQRLHAAVDQSAAELQALIDQATAEGINTQYAAISAHTLAIFQKAAANDFANKETVHEIFKIFHKIKEPRTGMEAEKLPFDELNACLDVAEYAKAQLRAQLDGAIKLPRAPDFAIGETTLGPGYYQLDGRPVFPSSIVWLNDDEDFWQSFGRIGQGYYSMAHLQPDGTVSARNLERAKESAAKHAAANMAPCVSFIGHSPARWMREQHPEILQGGRNFTQYDIDSPLVRKWMQQVIEAELPVMTEAYGDQPQMHLLANEPHFATAKGGWLAKNGLSDNTIAKYHAWLAVKYSDISALNKLYGTDYPTFEDVLFYNPKDKRYLDEPYRARQIDKEKTRGGPVWYDWVVFNQSRVSEWFTFLKEQVQANDGQGAPVTIKMLGFTLSRNTRDGGMDLEYLTNLQDVIGADLRVAPQGAEFFGKHEEGMDPDTGWKNHFIYDWVEQSMYLDFSKSLCPDKAFYDSEWHGFGAVSWRDFKLSREYVRSALWMAFSDGMSLIKPWVWGRTDEMALTSKADHIGEFATQPIAVDAYGRVMKELNAHAGWLAPGIRQPRDFMIYYCEESAIQDEDYTDGFKYVYEALRMLNLHTGFTTPTHISTLDPKTQTVLVSPTPFVKDESLAALRKFQEAGGRVIFVGESFAKNEQGFDRTDSSFSDAYATLPSGHMMDYIKAFESTLRPLMKAPLVDVKFTDAEGQPAYGVMMKQVSHPKTGNTIIVLNNISKDARSVALARGTYADLLTRQAVSPQFVMEPCDVRVLLVR